jgi:ATP-dependent Zn protease
LDPVSDPVSDPLVRSTDSGIRIRTKMSRIPNTDENMTIMQQICIRRTEDCLKQNMEKLDQLAELLLKKETLNYQDVEDLLGP